MRDPSPSPVDPAFMESSTVRALLAGYGPRSPDTGVPEARAPEMGVPGTGSPGAGVAVQPGRTAGLARTAIAAGSVAVAGLLVVGLASTLL